MVKIKEILILLVYLTIGFQNLIMVGGYSINVYLVIITGLVTVIDLLKTNNIYKKIIVSFIILFFIYLVYYIYSAVFDQDIRASTHGFVKNIQTILLFFLTTKIIRNEKTINAALQYFIIGNFVLIINVFYKYSTGNFGFYRLAAENYSQNYMALGLVTAIPFAFYLVVFIKKNRVLNLVYIGLVFIAIIMTASRSGMINYLLTITFLVLIYSRKVLMSSSIFYVVILLVAGIYLIVIFDVFEFSLLTRNIDRLLTSRTEIEYGDMNNRVYLWEESVKVFLDHPMGVGLGQFVHYNKLSLSSQNGFLSVLVNLGIFGFLAYIYLFYQLIQFIYKSEIDLIIKYCIYIIIFTVVLANFTSALEFNEIIWAPLTLAITLVAIIDKKNENAFLSD